jgi:beta-galactosidase
MHAGLLRPDSSEAAAWPEIEAVVRDLALLDLNATPATRARVALVVDVEAQWLGEIEQQGQSYDYTSILLQHYSALRGIDVDVDFIAPDSDPADYALIVVPALAMPRPGMAERLASGGAIVLFGPRSGAKTPELTYPEGLPPGPLRALLPMRVLSVETLRPGCEDAFAWNGRSYPSGIWRETVEPGDGVETLARYDDGGAALLRRGRVLYLATLSDTAFTTDLLEALCAEAGVATLRLPDDLRLRRRGDLVFALNYGAVPATAPAPEGTTFLIGGREIGARDVAIWRERA